ncbi:MAG: radical SAM family heme chaperone HemW [Gammaproteobacteria bacterium]|nr:radical SAM family heme chaperone HemW [Gammaproteobacteria bacterium]MDD9896518.1 radical SAM family heme chaperone HemW [Gammaproteobacteria bacterium]MDD9958727.1 radical SAM family heme chaperone HemW [Gammaproteobacteria bacterium]
MLERPPLSLYIHIPWCIRKCPYCDFNSHESGSPLPELEYINALLDDFNHEVARLENNDRELVSIFIGGGTPSLFDGKSYSRLLKDIESKLPFSEQIEITLEANPGTAEAARFDSYREAGINRLSIGAQSFDDECLKRLGRIHDAAEALRAIEIAKLAGFKNFNIDLMHGLPGQSSEQALKDIQKAIDCEPSHLSWYQLTIEPNTVFYSRPPTLPEECVLEDIQDNGQALLENHGYQQYEVSAYSKAGNASSHNLNYWSFGDYIGIGAGAHGKLTLIEESKLIRTHKMKQPNQYLNAINGRDAEIQEIAKQEMAIEFMMNSLRLRAGFSRAQFESRTGLGFDEIVKRVESLVERELIQMKNVERDIFISATPRGYRFLNSVIEEFL